MLCVLCVFVCFLAAQCHKLVGDAELEMSSVSISRLCKKSVLHVLFSTAAAAASKENTSNPIKKEKNNKIKLEGPAGKRLKLWNKKLLWKNTSNSVEKWRS